MNRTQYTLNSLLEELKESIPKFEKGQYFETLKSIYPSKEVLTEEKNIKLKKGEATKPLASSLKNKREYKKDKHPFYKFYKEYTRGDILEIIETDGLKAKCINRSLKEETIEEHYNTENMKYVTISYNDIVTGNIKRIYRGIKKLISGGKKL